jgi:hypothetical protein
MDLQADIDALLRDKHPTPFGSKHWQYACPEALQRIVAMTAIQFVLFEPEGRVKDNDEFKARRKSRIGDALTRCRRRSRRAGSRRRASCSCSKWSPEWPGSRPRGRESGARRRCRHRRLGGDPPRCGQPRRRNGLQ